MWPCPELVDTSNPKEDVPMAKNKRKFTPEFKAQAMKLARESKDRTLTDVARDLDLPLQTLWAWLKKAEQEETATRTPEQSELERLRRELEQVKLERDFLKKAAAFFAKNQ
jgi:transposase